MDIILSGYGTMCKVVENLAHEEGHNIVGVFSTIDIECPHTVIHDPEKIPKCDCIIDFSHPDNTRALLKGARIHRKPMIIATTGDRENLQKLMDEAAEYTPVFFSSNMSYGVHVFTKLLEYITPLLKGYDVEIIERHHNKKIDAPSGTAIKLLETIKSCDSDFYEVYDRFSKEHKRNIHEIGISSIRGGSIVGEHEVLFAGIDETIEITHRAQSKRIFANGAIKAAEKLIGRNPGFYTFDNL